jgi:N-acetylornithine carbamoyltransferase
MLRVPRSGKLVLSWAWHPKPLPQAVPNSTLTMAAQRGMQVVVHRPRGFELAADVMNEARALAANSGGSISESDDLTSLDGAHVVYAKSWGSLEHYGNAEAEARARAPLRNWCVTNDWMRRARSGAHFMHCLPVRRNVVVADEVLDGPSSKVIDQAENRLHAQTALLEAVFSSLPQDRSRAPTRTPRDANSPAMELQP